MKIFSNEGGDKFESVTNAQIYLIKNFENW